MTITYRLIKGSPLTHEELDENFRTLDNAFEDYPTTETMNNAIALAQTGTPIYRADDITGVKPIGTEFPTPTNGDTAVIWLSSGVREIWQYETSWVLRNTLGPVRTDYDNYRGLFGNFSQLGTDWPAGNKGDWVIISSSETYNGQAAYKHQRYRCTVDNTPAGTPANWQLILPEPQGDSTFARFQSNGLFHFTSGSRATVNLRIDDTIGPITVLEDTSTTDYQYVSGYINERGADTTVMSFAALKASTRNVIIDFVNVGNISQSQRAVINPFSGEFVKSEDLMNIERHDLGRAWFWTIQFPMFWPDMAYRIYPAAAPLGVPNLADPNFSDIVTGKFYITNMHFRGPQIAPESTWQNITLSNGWTSSLGTYDKMQVKKIGREAVFRGFASGGTPGPGYSIQLPANVRLGRQAIYPVCTSSGVYPMGFDLNGRGTFLLSGGETFSWFSLDGLDIRVK